MSQMLSVLQAGFIITHVWLNMFKLDEHRLDNYGRLINYYLYFITY